MFRPRPFCIDELQSQAAKRFLRSCVLLENLIINFDSPSRAFSSVDYVDVDASFKYVNVDDFLYETIEHERLKTLHICKKRIVVSTKCLAKLGYSKWWTKLRQITLNLGPNKNPLARADLTRAFEMLATSGNMRHVDIKIPSKFLLKIAMSSKNLQTLKNLTLEADLEDLRSIVNERHSTLEDVEICSDLSSEASKVLPECRNLKCLAIKSASFANLEILPKFERLTHLEIPVCANLGSG